LSIENENVTVSETVVKTDITKYSNRPDTPAILDILVERKKTGNLDKTFPIDLEYLLELREFWNIKTCMTFEQWEHGPENLKLAEQALAKFKQENALLREKLKELLVDSEIAEKRITELRTKVDGAHVLKLPLRKVNTFLMLCQDSDLKSDNSIFYVKLNEQGQLERMVRSPEEL
jgi:hypothetical protein